jgi:hypothetical protein
MVASMTGMPNQKAQRWDWGPAHARHTTLTTVETDALDAAVTDLAAHLAAAGVNPDSGHAEAIWLGVRCAIDTLTPLLRELVGPGPAVPAATTRRINALEDIASQAHQQWHRGGQPFGELLQQVERARGEYGGAP